MAANTDIVRLAETVPQWAGLPIEVRPLHGGITNRNFVVTVDEREYVIRIPGERTELLGIDRAHEAEAARRAAGLGLAPAVIGELVTVGTLITELVPGRHVVGAAFVDRLGDVVPLLLKFHGSGPLGGAFPIHRVVEWHARDAMVHGVAAPAIYNRLHRHSREIETAFGASPTPPVPCHNDLLPGNVLFGASEGASEGEGDNRAWLLDFEYAGNNDAFFDLGNLSVNCGLDPAGDERLLELYFGANSKSRWARLQLMKMMSEFREGMWAVVQQAISTLDTDFVSYAGERLDSCERLAAQPGWSNLLADAARSV